MRDKTRAQIYQLSSIPKVYLYLFVSGYLPFAIPIFFIVAELELKKGIVSIL